MSNPSYHPTETDVSSNLQEVIAENALLASRLSEAQLAAALEALRTARRVFVCGVGRSGLALQLFASRLASLGVPAYVTGEIATPPIAEGDLLLAASGSGRSAKVVGAASRAAAFGAEVLVFSTTEDSPLAGLADYVVLLPAGQRMEGAIDVASHQHTGSLFEQGVVVLGDALFQSLWAVSGTPQDELHARRPNLE